MEDWRAYQELRASPLRQRFVVCEALRGSSGLPWFATTNRCARGQGTSRGPSSSSRCTDTKETGPREMMSHVLDGDPWMDGLDAHFGKDDPLMDWVLSRHPP